MKDARHKLFSDIGHGGCHTQNCTIKGWTTGMHTNGRCTCLMNLNRNQMTILDQRLKNLLTELERAGEK